MLLKNLKTKIFLDSASANDTDVVLHELGFLDGQTTNPTLLAKHQDLKYLWPLSQEALWDFYKSEALRINKIIPNGEISVEVYADEKSNVQSLINQAVEISSWFTNCYVKLPITTAGLEAAQQLIKQNVKLNMTLCFSQAQALAVHLATKGAVDNQVVISPFIGRLDDVGICGMDLINNIIKMNKNLKSKVRVLTASIRTAEQLSGAVYLQSDILTAPRNVLEKWKEYGFNVGEYKNKDHLEPIEYNNEIVKTTDWQNLDYEHELTTKGLSRFVSDWSALIK